MELRDDQRRAVIAMCCAVARADGEVSPAELEALLGILVKFAEGLVSYTELQRWLDEGPPDISASFREDELRACVRDALAVAQADGTIDEAELGTIKRYAERHLHA